LRKRLLANASVLFDDTGAVDSLQQFLLAEVGGAAPVRLPP